MSATQDRKKYPYLRKVRITAVDNFQGEDNKIILLSLVRSNANANIGYLAFKNRICVALSRAKHGFYIIGNMSTLSTASHIWKKINEQLLKQKAIGSELDLMCSTHKTVHKVSARFRTYLRHTQTFKDICPDFCSNKKKTSMDSLQFADFQCSNIRRAEIRRLSKLL